MAAALSRAVGTGWSLIPAAGVTDILRSDLLANSLIRIFWFAMHISFICFLAIVTRTASQLRRTLNAGPFSEKCDLRQ